MKYVNDIVKKYNPFKQGADPLLKGEYKTTLGAAADASPYVLMLFASGIAAFAIVPVIMRWVNGPSEEDPLTKIH